MRAAPRLAPFALIGLLATSSGLRGFQTREAEMGLAERLGDLGEVVVTHHSG